MLIIQSWSAQGGAGSHLNSIGVAGLPTLTGDRSAARAKEGNLRKLCSDPGEETLTRSVSEEKGESLANASG